MSPTGDFLATTHVDSLGIYLWSVIIALPVTVAQQIICADPLRIGLMWSANHSKAFLLRTNKSLCGPVGLRPLPADYQPTETTLPGVTAEDSEEEAEPEEVDDAYQSAEQLGAELVTLSLLPESRWKSLLHLDVIKVSPSAGSPSHTGLNEGPRNGNELFYHSLVGK